MNRLFKYLVSICCMAFTLYLYVDTMHTEDIDPNGINIELGKYTALHKSGDADLSPFPHGKHMFKCYTENKGHKKIQHVKHIVFEATIQKPVTLPQLVFQEPGKITVVNSGYHYLFYREINPPPPKLHLS